MSTMSKKRQSEWRIEDEPLDIIAAHIRENEKAPDHPYLDTKGNVTVGAGRLVTDLGTFKRIPFSVDGRPATAAEKEAAWSALQALKKAKETDAGTETADAFNRKADLQADLTKLRIPPTEIERDLAAQVASRVRQVRDRLGAETWDRLDANAKAVLVDLHYSVGNIEGFGKLRKAADDIALARRALEGLPEGSAARRETEARLKDARTRMAQESHAYSGETVNKAGNEVPRRNWERIARNHCTALGLAVGGETCKAAVAGYYADRGPEREAFPRWLEERLGTPKPAAPADAPPSGDPAEAAALRGLRDGLARGPEDAAEAALLKDPADWTEDELRAAHGSRAYHTPGHPDRDAAVAGVRAHFRHRTGDGPAPRDATGRLVEAPDRNPPPSEPRPLVTADGTPLVDGLARLAGAVVSRARGDGAAAAVRGLQHGLNLLGDLGRDPGPEPGRDRPAVGLPLDRLKTDGIAGPKTRAAARRAVAAFGPARVTAALDLGRLRDGLDGPEPLGPARPDDPARAMVPALQRAIDETGRAARGPAWTPLKADGIAGPKTAAGLRTALAAAGPDRLLRQTARDLGFF